jgi:type III secretion protein L
METKLIKAGPRILNKPAQDAYQQSESILDAARQRATAILAEAELQRDDITERARAQAYKDGLTQWNEALERADHVVEQNTRNAEQQIIRLSVRIAEKIIGEQIRLEPNVIVSIVREALKSVRRERHIVLRVHPDHVDAVRRQLDSLRAETGCECDYRVTPDVKLQAGGCVIETEIGTIDARLDVQLQVLEELLLRTKR